MLIGIDPGITGGVAVMDVDYVNACALPTMDHFSGKGNEVDLDAVNKWINEERKKAGEGSAVGIDLFVIEHVGNMNRRGSDGTPVKMGATGMFNFGDTFGQLRALAKLKNWKVNYPRPQVWQSSLFGNQYGKEDSKALALSFVTRRFPGVSLLATPRCKTPHKGMVDALCLVEYAFRVATGAVNANKKAK